MNTKSTKYFNLSEINDFDKNEMENIIAYCYPVKIIDEETGNYEPDRSGKEAFFLTSSKNKKNNTISEGGFKIKPPGYRLAPMLHVNKPNTKNVQRDIMVVFGASGSGKTVLSNTMAKIYKKMTGNPIYYISSKNMMRDPSFNAELFEFIPFEHFITEVFDDEAIEEFKKNDMWDNSLVIIDDIVLNAGNKEEKAVKDLFYKWLKIVMELKRMNNISLLWITHQVSDYSYTRTLFTEMTAYVTFSNDLKNRSNLILKDYLKLSPKEIDIITSTTSRWTCIKTRHKVIITDTEVYCLK